MSRKIKIILFGSFVLLILGVYSLTTNRKDIIIQEAKVVTGVDKNIMPLKVTNFFPKNTSKVCVWISWHSAKINTQILVKWYYLTDDIPIYNYVLTISKRQGVANVELSIPEGKSLPSGSYKADIFSGKKHLTKTLTFEIE
jgi:hypothetical protein